MFMLFAIPAFSKISALSLVQTITVFGVKIFFIELISKWSKCECVIKIAYTNTAMAINFYIWFLHIYLLVLYFNKLQNFSKINSINCLKFCIIPQNIVLIHKEYTQNIVKIKNRARIKLCFYLSNVFCFLLFFFGN